MVQVWGKSGPFCMKSVYNRPLRWCKSGFLFFISRSKSVRFCTELLFQSDLLPLKHCPGNDSVESVTTSKTSTERLSDIRWRLYSPTRRQRCARVGRGSDPQLERDWERAQFHSDRPHLFDLMRTYARLLLLSMLCHHVSMNVAIWF
jgi:hypothetical protein